MATQLPSSSSSVSNDFTYDVFISFRGIDTRYGFTGHLYKALSNKGIHTFIDDKELQRGDEITPSLFKNIEDSRIAIIIFSKNYASSSFCLDELAHIIHCSNEKGSTVIPVFYGTEPSHVRKLNDSYGEALAKHEEGFQNNKENTERLLKWKKALNQAANLSGYHINLGNEYEHDVIENIVTDVSYKINHVPFHVADHLVGLQSRISAVMSLLDLGCTNGVCTIGILGAGGLGKTTLVETVYNLIAKQFECLCFLHNVRENSVKHGLVYLQEQLLSKSIGFKTKFGHVNEGIPFIKRSLCKKKVLLILDDVDELEQLRSLFGKPDWLGPSSKVIITTRDKRLLHGIEKVYEAHGLNEEQALELLRNVAFKSKKNDSSYDYILNRAAKYASGLPLALEVVGSNLFERSVEECEFLLDKYERIPHKNILKTLKVSFDALEDDQKSVFLDIACFFKGCNLASIQKELQSQYHDIEINLTVLVEKSLIKIDFEHWNGPTVILHDLIEDMGKEIVRQESPNNPGERSRLWFHEDIVKVLEEDMGTARIKMIYLKCPIYPMSKNVIEGNGNAFKKMTNLKSLVIKNVDFSKDPENLPSDLRVLSWERCPLMSPSSSIWNKKFNYMKILTLKYCEFLTHIPDISGLPNLEKFSFEYCQNLITIDNSVGQLDKLEILYVSLCEKIESFPPLRLPSLKKLTIKRCTSLITIDNSVGQLDKLEILCVSHCEKIESFPPLQLPSLKKLKLNECTNLKRFPEILCKMTNLKEFMFYDTPIKEFSNSFQNLSQIRCLDMREKWWWSREDLKDNEKMNSSENIVLSKMEYLYLARGSISDKCLQMLLNWCLNVTHVDLSKSNLKTLPECLSECHHLRKLYLDDCFLLEEIRGFPPNLEEFSAKWCYSLSSSSRRMLLSQELHEKLHEAGYKKFRLITGTEGIPDWFEHQSRGYKTISFQFRKKIPSINVIILRETELPYHEVKLYVNDRQRDLPEGKLYKDEDEVPQKHGILFDLKLEEVLLENEWITVMLKLKNEYDNGDRYCRNVQIGIHVWKEKNNIEEDVKFTNPYSSDTEEDDDENDDSSEFEPSMKKQRLVEARVSETEYYKEFDIFETEFVLRQSLDVSENRAWNFAQMVIHMEEEEKEDVIFTQKRKRMMSMMHALRLVLRNCAP